MKLDTAKVHAPVPLITPEAEIPDEARLKLENGMCVLSLTVDAEGVPKNPQVVRCTDPIFMENSIKTAMKYRFQPARRIDNGAPVPVIITIEENFRKWVSI